ncbi:hypothetical protein V1264_004785 [Littorina saxatilis]|uniref:Uncharacterized protein n=2 Tax=Littorina saxatilis TaxID=31220 RepID=A0AAN9B5H9_9CAEN
MSYRFVDLRTNTDKTGEMTRLPRFRNPAAALGLLPTPRSCRLPNSPASSPDGSRVASPDLETSPMPHTSSVSHSPPGPEASPEIHGMLTPQTSPQPYRCVCQRPQSLIMCSSCGFTVTGVCASDHSPSSCVLHVASLLQVCVPATTVPHHVFFMWLHCYRCVCQRPQSLIMCSSCGFTFTGRVRSPCSAHPSQIYLMDNEVCPECSSACLREYKY